MTSSTFFLIGTGCVVCLVPLAIYLLILSWFNQRDRVTVLSGTWDGALLVFGLSGFLIVAGPVFLLVADSSFREIVYYGSTAKARSAGLNPGQASLLSIGWLALVGGLVAMFLKKRRRRTALYNVVPSSLLESLHLTIPQMEPVASGKKIVLKQAEGTSFSFEMDHQQFSHHTVVAWDQPQSPLRDKIEAGWRQSAQAIPENLVGGWLFTGSLVIFMAVLIWAGFLIYLLLSAGRS